MNDAQKKKTAAELWLDTELPPPSPQGRAEDSKQRDESCSLDETSAARCCRRLCSELMNVSWNKNTLKSWFCPQELSQSQTVVWL